MGGETSVEERAGEQERFSQFYEEANAQTVYEFLAFRPDNPNSIVQCITKARENARTIRDRISREMWEDINGLYHSVTRFDPAEQISSGPHRFCDAVKFGSHRFFGVTDATLPHDEGWDFLKIGWSLERAEMTARLVDLQFQSLLETPFIAGTANNHQWMAVLKSVGAYEAYGRQYHSPIEPERVAEMLILHPKHPRSIRFSITELQTGLRAISGTAPGSYANEAERRCNGTVAGFAHSAAELIHERFQYVKGATHVNSSIADSLHLGAGVCQDFAHVLLGVLRKAGDSGPLCVGIFGPAKRGES